MQIHSLIKPLLKNISTAGIILCGLHLWDRIPLQCLIGLANTQNDPWQFQFSWLKLSIIEMQWRHFNNAKYWLFNNRFFFLLLYMHTKFFLFFQGMLTFLGRSKVASYLMALHPMCTSLPHVPIVYPMKRHEQAFTTASLTQRLAHWPLLLNTPCH